MNIKALIKKYEAVECVVGIVSGKNYSKNRSKRLETTGRTATSQSSTVCGGFYRRTEKTGSYTVLLNRRMHV